MNARGGNDPHFLIVKHGALGDVVRTSYLAHALRRKHGDSLRLSWLTASACVPLLRFNPCIDDIWTSLEEARAGRFARVFSLDDEADAIDTVARLDAAEVVGAYRDVDGTIAYSDDSAAWFDMGLLSRFGKRRADELKKANERGHADIFAQVFAVDCVLPLFFGSRRLETWAQRWMPEGPWYVGINAFAGGRWPSKELPAVEIPRLIDGVLRHGRGRAVKVVLLGAGADYERNLSLAQQFPSDVMVAATDDSVLRLAAVISRLQLMITSDSLALHLAIAQAVPTIAFFAPTSAAEIDDFGRVAKVISTAPDYCSYRRDADNSTITAERLLEVVRCRFGVTTDAMSVAAST
jgi:heptosyltransferase-2